MERKRALSIIYECAKNYDSNLRDNNVIFVIEKNKSFKSKNSIDFVETIYYIQNFFHLTGIDYENKNKSYKFAKYFYSNLLRGKISYKEIKYKNPITTKLKLEILNNLCCIDKTAKLIGDYNNITKNNLYTEKIVGNINYCFGLIKDTKTKYYIPNSAIKDNIKNITDDISNVVTILKKHKKEKFYSKITYIKKGFNLNNLYQNSELISLIDLKNLSYDNFNDIRNTNKVNEFKNKNNE